MSFKPFPLQPHWRSGVVPWGVAHCDPYRIGYGDGPWPARSSIIRRFARTWALRARTSRNIRSSGADFGRGTMFEDPTRLGPRTSSPRPRVGAGKKDCCRRATFRVIELRACHGRSPQSTSSLELPPRHPCLGSNRADAGQVGPNSTKSGRSRPNLGRSRPDVARF